MHIKQLLQGIIGDIGSFDDIEVTGIAVDSRKVKPGFLFLALKGHQDDGKVYIQQALAKGARVILSEEPLQIEHAIHFCLPNIASYVADIACRFYDYPGKNLSITGITGTNGKTTIAYLLSQAHIALGRKSAYIGTLGAGIIGDLVDTGMTTPGPIELQSICHDFVESGLEDVVMEVSSHALHQNRISGLDVKFAVFTNLTHDHLDYHPSIADYAESKAKLFQMPGLEAVIMNMDDPYHEKMLKHANSQAKVYGYAMNTPTDVYVKNTFWTLEGMHLELSSLWGDVNLHMRLLGQFNIYNALAVFTCLMAQGYKLNHVLKVMKTLKPAPGRMEVCAQSPLVIVDYAHTPDALKNALYTLKEFKEATKAGDLWVVFGCGGNRDPFKRPVMGKIAHMYADQVIITSDNPRHEQPTEIMSQIVGGMSSEKKFMQIEDRKLAILTCLEQAKSEDIVLIAGKGHEDYQIIGDEKFFFSDQAVVNEFNQTQKSDSSFRE